MAELERLMDGVPASREFAALRKRPGSLSCWGGGSEDSVSLGGVALVRFMSKGRRGMGRRRGGPSSAMVVICMYVFLLVFVRPWSSPDKDIGRWKG